MPVNAPRFQSYTRHVFAELEAYAPLINSLNYFMVLDAVIEGTPAKMSPDSPLGLSDNSKTAAQTYVRTHPEF